MCGAQFYSTECLCTALVPAGVPTPADRSQKSVTLHVERSGRLNKLFYGTSLRSLCAEKLSLNRNKSRRAKQSIISQLIFLSFRSSDIATLLLDQSAGEGDPAGTSMGHEHTAVYALGFEREKYLSLSPSKARCSAKAFIKFFAKLFFKKARIPIRNQ